jgi:hypothetical protein
MRMALASWILIAAAVACALGVFLPVLEVAGHVISKRETLSLHGAANNRALVRKLLATYRKSEALHVDHAIGKVSPHSGRAKEYLDDTTDAMDTLSGISDEDAVQAGRALVILTWIVIGIAAMAVALIFFDVVSGTFHRGRIIGAVLVTLILAALAIAIRIGCGLVAFEANDELGAELVRLGVAATLMPAAALVTFGSAVTLLVLHVRSRRKA